MAHIRFPIRYRELGVGWDLQVSLGLAWKEDKGHFPSEENTAQISPKAPYWISNGLW